MKAKDLENMDKCWIGISTILKKLLNNGFCFSEDDDVIHIQRKLYEDEETVDGQTCSSVTKVYKGYKFMADIYSCDGVITAFIDLFGRGLRHQEIISVDSDIEYAVKKLKRMVDDIIFSSTDNKVYLMRNERNGYTKIGVSKNIKHRERTLQSEEPEITLLWFTYGDYKDESILHGIFNNKRLRGEWFDLDENDVNLVKRLKWKKDGR